MKLMDQLIALEKGRKSAVYEVFAGEFVEGQMVPSEVPNNAWRRYYRRFNRILKKFDYIHAEGYIPARDGFAEEKVQLFLVYRENPYNVDEGILKDAWNHDRVIGLSIGIPEFAVEDFVKRNGEPGKLFAVDIKKLGLIFTMRQTEENLQKLREFWESKGLKEKDVKISKHEHTGASDKQS